ncbi:hypothetical protein SUGI_0810530 [Cryptomeria japonica]|nr:hypothetical protein SUGI_0810530 [Cryptomeria japonica]
MALIRWTMSLARERGEDNSILEEIEALDTPSREATIPGKAGETMEEYPNVGDVQRIKSDLEIALKIMGCCEGDLDIDQDGGSFGARTHSESAVLEHAESCLRGTSNYLSTVNTRGILLSLGQTSMPLVTLLTKEGASPISPELRQVLLTMKLGAYSPVAGVTLKMIGEQICSFLVVDDHTEDGEFGMYARICMFVDLDSPHLEELEIRSELGIWRQKVQMEMTSIRCKLCHLARADSCEVQKRGGDR